MFFLSFSSSGFVGKFSDYEKNITENDLNQQVYYSEMAINDYRALMRMCSVLLQLTVH